MIDFFRDMFLDLYDNFTEVFLNIIVMIIVMISGFIISWFMHLTDRFSLLGVIRFDLCLVIGLFLLSMINMNQIEKRNSDGPPLGHRGHHIGGADIPAADLPDIYPPAPFRNEIGGWNRAYQVSSDCQ